MTSLGETLSPRSRTEMSRDKANKRLQKIQITYNRIEYKELEFCEGDDVSLRVNAAKLPYFHVTEEGTSLPMLVSLLPLVVSTGWPFWQCTSCEMEGSSGCCEELQGRREVRLLRRGVFV